MKIPADFKELKNYSIQELEDQIAYLEVDSLACGAVASYYNTLILKDTKAELLKRIEWSL